MAAITLPHIFPVACHTDNVGPCTTFVAIKGKHYDGAVFIEQALKQGARSIIADQQCKISSEAYAACTAYNVPVELVENARHTLALQSAQAAGHPAQSLKIIGVTGTKGKTTSCFMLAHCLKKAGYKTALLSSVYNQIHSIQFPTSLTTPHPDYLQVFLKKCVEEKIDYVIMEVAAQAVTLSRVATILFDALLFTNFSHEHGEFYASPDKYLEAKTLLLTQLKPDGTVFLNGDDAACKRASINLKKFFSFGRHYTNDYHLAESIITLAGTQFTVARVNQALKSFFSPLGGTFNLYNCLGVVAVLDQLIPTTSVQEAVASFNGAPGRMELHPLPNGARCYIDYASNPASFEAILSTLAPSTDHLVVVFGCGGDRDPQRRPLMGKISSTYAHKIFLTTDNPRSEDPAHITHDIVSGIPIEHHAKITVQLDRAKAIQEAYSLTTPTSLLLLLGKGAEEYQIVGTKKITFNERTVLNNLTP